MEPELGKKGRDARRMARFPCKGVLYLTPRDGYFDCLLSHSIDHVRYKDISIPDFWLQYIKDNHKIGPTNVSIHRFIHLVLAESAG